MYAHWRVFKAGGKTVTLQLPNVSNVCEHNTANQLVLFVSLPTNL